MLNGIGEVYTYRKQSKVNKGFGYFDPSKVFTKIDDNGKVKVDGNLSTICKKDEADTVIIEGKVYKTVKIGNQVWLAENLAIKIGTENPEDVPEVAACWEYNNNIYYNGYAVNLINVPGWHVPTNSEWNTLFTFVGGTSIAGQKLKSVDYTGGTDEYGFNLKKTGFRNYEGNNLSTPTRLYCSNYTSNNIYFVNFTDNDSVATYNYSPVQGMCVRLVKDA